MNRNHLAGGALLGAVLLATVAVFTLVHKPVAKPAPAAPAVARKVQPVAQATSDGWNHFQCTQGRKVVQDFPKAKATFLGRRYERVYWQVVTPVKTITFNVNPTRITCSNVKA
jgi:hypothetical protein